MRMGLVYTGIMILGIATAVWAQQPLTSQQQCANHVQELVLADIAHQEARARTGNIMRQAYELETEVKKLKNENAELQEEVRALKASSEVGDVPAKTE